MGSDEFYEKQARVSNCKDLLLSAKEEAMGIYELNDLVSYIDITLDEIRKLEREEI